MFQSHSYAIRMALTVFPILALLLLIPYMIHQYYKHGSIVFFKAVIIYTFIFYILNATFLVMLPLPPRSVVAKMTGPRFDFQVLGFLSDWKALGLFDSIPFIQSITHDRFLEPLLNICLTIPFGVYLRYYFKKSWWLVIFFSFSLSLFFELSQLSGLYGIYVRPHRLFQVDDLMLNTFGGLVGYVLTPLFVFMFPSKDDLDELSIKKSSHISITRRIIANIIDFALIFGLGLTFFKFYYKSIRINLLLRSPLRYVKHLILNPDVYLAAFAIMFVFFVITPWITKGFTMGKRIIGIKLSQTNSDHPKFFNLLFRFILFYSFIFTFYWAAIISTGRLSLSVFQHSLRLYAPWVLIFLLVSIASDIVYATINDVPFLYERLSKINNITFRIDE